ncbi:hypothetical protein [Archangium lansingense]|uniref:Uncharacterized protein n=1 Tax=Archangium lansingense TaxID=2995310 RepID=A0ABT4APE9_9BACT|nr:hypothetical protein [Archangium lansinium]MCY1083580.1 hypothetical protein [Archangium lansinium]
MSHVRLICILREPEGLMALALSEKGEDAGLLRLPLHTLSENEVPGRTALLGAWESLARARGATAETLTRVLQVLLTTEPGDGTPPPGLEHPWLEPPPAPHRRTAAHPRGYRGTLHQPPKRPQPEALDVRPHLLHRRTLGALLEPLRPHVTEAVRQLEEEGYSRERLERVAVALASPARADVALAYHHGLLDTRGAELPASFIRLGALLSRGPERGFSRLLALRGRLAIDTDPAVLTAAARLLLRWGPEQGLPWLEVAAQLGPETQVELLTELVKPGVTPFSADRYDLQFEAFATRRASWRWDYLRGLGAGLPSDYLLSGFRLLAAHGLDASLSMHLPSAAGPVPEECLDALFVHLLPETRGHWALPSLWSLCGELPGFAELLTSVPWMSLTPEAAYALVTLLSTLGWYSLEGRPERLRWWSMARRLLPALLEQLSRTPASHQRRCVEMMCRLVANGESPWEVSSYLVPTSLALAGRVCRPPFSGDNRLAYVLEALVKHPDPRVRERLLAAPERSFLRFDECCAREDLATLAGKGMEWLVEHDVGLVLDAFESCPETLARTARLLGTLWRHEALPLLAEFARHPLVREDPFQLPPEQLAVLLREHCVGGVESPLPRKARLALEEGRELPPGQWARALRVASTQRTRLRLQVLARRVLERLRGRMQADTKDERVRHALQMANLVHDNRRALRRLLARYFEGERDFIEHHPVSRAWFARHPRVERESWLKGVVLRREVPGLGEVTLSLEQDALEALRLGTHVGSCLGLNGICDYSAAAVVLDINKRVLYARDSRGRVVARQLLAISDDDKLVPFKVYPESCPQALQSVFLDYDLAFAETLGLPLSDGPEEPEVENVLSSCFWHDGAWELGAPG